MCLIYGFSAVLFFGLGFTAQENIVCWLHYLLIFNQSLILSVISSKINSTQVDWLQYCVSTP